MKVITNKNFTHEEQGVLSEHLLRVLNDNTDINNPLVFIMASSEPNVIYWQDVKPCKESIVDLKKIIKIVKLSLSKTLLNDFEYKIEESVPEAIQLEND